MKLNIPFYTQEINECGPIALQMVLEFLGEKHSKEKIKNLVCSETNGTTFTVGLAKAAASLGFKVELCSISLGANPQNFELEFYKKNTNVDKYKEKVDELIAECNKLGVKFTEKSLTNKEIFEKMSKDCIPIVLLDWSKIKGAGSFQGHFVPIAGFDDKFVYVHNPGVKDPKQFFPIELSLFEIARKAKGTDEDILFISRKAKML